MRMPARHCHQWSMRLSMSLSRCLAGNSEPLHHGNQGRPGQAEFGSGSTLSADNPIGLAKRRRDVRPISVGERPDWHGPHVSCYVFHRRRVQYGPRRHDLGALDDILQFSDTTAMAAA
jgi:hypothetical protein